MGDSTTVTVLVDTTELAKSPLLSSRAWRELGDRGKRGQVSIQIPHVVVRETRRHVRRDLADAHSKSSKANALWKSLGISTAHQLPDVDRCLADYEKDFRLRLQEIRAEELPVPTISHSELLERDLLQRKPFDQNGKGYRDALIWETVLAATRANPTSEFLFVTGNRGDFCDKTGDLASVLRNELPDFTRLTVFHSVSEASSALNDIFEDDDNLREFHESEFDHTTIVEKHITATLESLSLANLSQFMDLEEIADIDEIEIRAADADMDTLDFQIQDSHEGETASIYASVEAVLTLEGFMLKADFGVSDTHGISVANWNWNDRVAVVHIEQTARIAFDLQISGTQVTSSQLNEITLK